MTASVVYTDGNVTRRNVTATVKVLNPSGAIVATKSTTAATLPVGATMNVALQWPTASSAPGTYTLSSSPRRRHAESSSTASTFEVRSRRGHRLLSHRTITSTASVYLGDTLPLRAVGVTNGGNAALTAAPFAVVIRDATTLAEVKRLSVSVTAAVGATFTASAPWTATGIPVGFYRARTGLDDHRRRDAACRKDDRRSPAPPLKLELSIGAPARILIWSDCANGNSTQPCTATKPAFLTDYARRRAFRGRSSATSTRSSPRSAPARTTARCSIEQGPYEGKVFAEYAEMIREASACC